MEAVKGSQIDCCGYPLSGLPREPPGVRVPLQLHHRRLGQHSPVHSSSVVGDPWRPESHLPTPAPPSPSQTERSLGWCALWAPPFTRAVAPPPRPRARAGSRAGQRSGALEPLLLPSLSAVGGWSSPRQHHQCLEQSGGVDPPSRAPRERAPVPHAVVGPLAACQ